MQLGNSIETVMRNLQLNQKRILEQKLKNQIKNLNRKK